MATQFVEGDTAAKVVVTCKDAESGAALDLSDKSVSLRFGTRRPSGPGEWRLIGTPVIKPMTIRSPASAGVVEYQFAAGELQHGSLTGEVIITNDDETFLTQTQPFSVTVRRVLGSA